jgi:hypothetical protein
MAKPFLREFRAATGPRSPVGHEFGCHSRAKLGVTQWLRAVAKLRRSSERSVKGAQKIMDPFRLCLQQVEPILHQGEIPSGVGYGLVIVAFQSFGLPSC